MAKKKEKNILAELANGKSFQELAENNNNSENAAILNELGINSFEDMQRIMEMMGIDMEKFAELVRSGDDFPESDEEFAKNYMRQDFLDDMEDEDFDEDGDFDEDEDYGDDDEVYDDFDDFMPYHITKYFHDVPAHEFHLRFKLNNAPVGVWREIKVPSNISLELLGYIIEELMGWGHEHLHQFRAGGCNYCSADELRELENSFFVIDAQRDANEYPLDTIFKEKGKRIVFEYDYGDSWCHDVWLKGIRDYKDGEPQVLKVVKGQGQCPPEDCGGVWGYKMLLDTLAKKRKSAEEKERLEWYNLDKDYDPMYYDLEEEQYNAEDVWEDLRQHADK